LVKGIVGIAVVVNLRVGDGSGLAVLKGEALIEVWAVLKTGDVRTDVLGLGKGCLLLVESVIGVAVVVGLWIWDSFSSTILKGESLIKIGAVLKASNVRADVLSLSQGIVGVAVVVDLWVWDSFGLAVLEGEALIKIWAVLETGNVRSDVLDERLRVGFLGVGILCTAVVSFLWVWDSTGPSIDKGESLVEVWAVLEASNV